MSNNYLSHVSSFAVLAAYCIQRYCGLQNKSNRISSHYDQSISQKFPAVSVCNVNLMSKDVEKLSIEMDVPEDIVGKLNQYNFFVGITRVSENAS